MRRAKAIAGAVGAAAALAAASPAAAADQTVQAVDGTNVWSPSEVTVKAGEKVTWTFSSAAAHNVASTSPNWSFRTEFGVGQPPATFTFPTPGTYTFVCELHASTMLGKVTVTDDGGNPPPPPPPPPPSEQPWVNDAPPLAIIESGGRDRRRPRLRGVRIRAVRNGARVRFRVSERARVRVHVKLRGVRLKSRTVRVARRGRVTIRGLRSGRYRVVVRAIDPAGNRSRPVARWVRFR